MHSLGSSVTNVAFICAIGHWNSQVPHGQSGRSWQGSGQEQMVRVKWDPIFKVPGQAPGGGEQMLVPFLLCVLSAILPF